MSFKDYRMMSDADLHEKFGENWEDKVMVQIPKKFLKSVESRKKAAEKQRLKDEKAAEKQRLKDEKAVKKQRLKDEKAVKKQKLKKKVLKPKPIRLRTAIKRKQYSEIADDAELERLHSKLMKQFQESHVKLMADRKAKRLEQDGNARVLKMLEEIRNLRKD